MSAQDHHRLPGAPANDVPVTDENVRLLLARLRTEKPQASGVANLLEQVLDAVKERDGAPAGVRAVRSSVAWWTRTMVRLRATVKEVLDDRR